MFRDHNISSYTGLACTFSFLIREHGAQPIYNIVLDAARDYSSADPSLSDALAKLAIAISSASVNRAAEGVPRVKKAWRMKTDARLKAWDSVIQIADSISYQNLGLYHLMEIPEPPLGLPVRPLLIMTEPVSKIERRLEEFSKKIDDEYSWYSWEKFVTSEYPALIESQIELYDQLIAILQAGESESRGHPFSILKVRKGSIHKISEISQRYECARTTLPKLKVSIKRFEEALQEELNGGRLWDNVRYEIEKGLPDEIGRIISYETIKAIEQKAEGITKEG